MEYMAPNDIISVSTLGDVNVLNTITPQSLLKFYNEIFNSSWVNIGIIGDISKEEVINNFIDFKFPSINHKVDICPKNIEYKEKVLEVCEKQDIVQAKLLMAFRYDIDYSSKYYIPLIVFNAMYGGMFGSSLFMTVREKHSLTYDISSELLLNKKTLIVSCGVDNANVELIKEKIENSVNPRKWICVEADEVEVESKGNLIILIMSSEFNAEKIETEFNKL
jgi:predicted Zn-dependent peptidase